MTVTELIEKLKKYLSDTLVLIQGYEGGSLVLMTGKKDKYNYEPIKELGKWLKNRGTNVNLVEYDGGHILPE